MPTIKELKAAERKAVADARAETDPARRLELNRAAKQAGLDLAAAITEGAEPCPKCGAHPHGMLQPLEARGTVLEIVEIGCVNCMDHSAYGVTRENAIENWHEGIMNYGDGPQYDENKKLVSVPEGWRKSKR